MLAATYDVVYSFLLNGAIYVDYRRYPSPDKPSLIFETVALGRYVSVAGYRVLPIAVRHAVPAVGYYVMSPDGAALLYTGDTGAGFLGNAGDIRPGLIITEVTAPDRLAASLERPGHLCAGMLKAELPGWRAVKGYIPRVPCIHIHPIHEEEIRAEIRQVADDLGADIGLGHEGMVVEVR